MIRSGVFAAAGGLILAGAPAISAMEAGGTSGAEARLHHDALRRGMVLTEEALEAYRASKPTRSRLSPEGPLAGGILGGVVAGSIARQAGRTGTNTRVDDHPDAGNLDLERTSPATVRASVGGFLDALANIRVKVRPAPPRDYVVTINGRPYPASERSIYAIPPGVVQVSVTRKGKPPCHWAGAVTAESDKILDCRL